ncbi:uncharacterized protein [Haliotis asinina]|uniref:uncharacterized protein n=1 Tax=Haliotis asinina TaxID=109174 RepID=UPI003531976D
MWLLFVLSLFMLSTAVVGESHCYNASSSRASLSTTCHQHGGCIKGWFGPTCQKQNVALKRPATQTSVFFERHQTSRPLNLTADYAVDGIVSNHLRDSPCAHTDVGDTTPSWTVFLNSSGHYKIHHLKLYLRKTQPYRNNGMEILVDNQTCYDWSPAVRPDSVIDVTCRQPLSGNSVTIRTPQEFLTLCEVQIFACSDGWFGDDCDKQCHCLDSKEVCDKITGHCSGGCTSGFTGANCQTPCSDGWFGENCDKQCHCLDSKEVCDKITGYCFSGCTPGFSDCQTCTYRMANGYKVSFLTTLVVAITCGVVIFIIVLVASLCIRRLQMKIKALETPHEEPYASLDPETREQMSETCYTEIAESRTFRGSRIWNTVIRKVPHVVVCNRGTQQQSCPVSRESQGPDSRAVHPFIAHSSRADTATAMAYHRNISVVDIMVGCYWKFGLVFANHYLRALSNEDLAGISRLGLQVFARHRTGALHHLSWQKPTGRRNDKKQTTYHRFFIILKQKAAAGSDCRPECRQRHLPL